MYWPKRQESNVWYIDSFKTAIGKYDVYLYKDVCYGLLLQDNKEGWDYACMSFDILKNILEHGAYNPTTGKHGIVSIQYGIAYRLFEKSKYSSYEFVSK